MISADIQTRLDKSEQSSQVKSRSLLIKRVNRTRNMK